MATVTGNVEPPQAAQGTNQITLPNLHMIDIILQFNVVRCP